MTAQSAIPLKWYVPFATGDSSRVEIPVTSSNATRASQMLGFPPLTMQPPAVGGVPPQGEDFNGAMNQVARIAWWVLNGGGWPYDATFATNSNIGGYPNGAVLQSADFLGQWISTADNNQNNPDTVGTSWVPGFQYGSTALTGQTGGTTTLTPLQAAKRGITISGTLTSALTVIMPTWIKDWSITNNTTGAYTVIVKTAAGSGVTIPQNDSPTLVAGDGTNVTQNAQNIPLASSPTHAAPMSQVAGVVGATRNFIMNVATASATASATADEVIVETALGGTRYCLASFNQTINLATIGAGGMDTGSSSPGGFVALYAGYNPATGARTLFGTNATNTSAPNIYGGANLPSGYTATALVAVVLTNGSGLILPLVVLDRLHCFTRVQVLSVVALIASFTSFSIAAAVPKNAKTWSGTVQLNSSSVGTLAYDLAGSSSGFGAMSSTGDNTQQIGGPTGPLPIIAAQTAYYRNLASGGATITMIVACTQYTI